MADPDYIIRFAKAVYPEMTELAMSIATEKSILTDAAEEIETLRDRVEKLEGLIKAVDSCGIGEAIRTHTSENTYEQWIKVVSDEN